MFRLSDPITMPLTGETAEQRLQLSVDLEGTPGQDYVEKRGIPLNIAHAAGVRYDANWNGRAAVLVPMRDDKDRLCSLHGRYLQQTGKENKMFTIGPGGGIIKVNGTTLTHVLIIVEGLFDALSVAVGGYGSFATVGRWAPWLPEFCTNKNVLIGFDAARSGEEEYEIYKQRLPSAHVQRLYPPDNCKDWNTALLKRGKIAVARSIENALRNCLKSINGNADSTDLTDICG